MRKDKTYSKAKGEIRYMYNYNHGRQKIWHSNKHCRKQRTFVAQDLVKLIAS